MKVWWMVDWSACGKWSSAQVWREQQRRRVWHTVLDMKNACLVRQRFLTRWLKSWAKREKSNVCGSATCAWVGCSSHSTSLTKESPLPVSETPWLWKFKENISFTPTWCLWHHEEDCHHEDRCHPEEEELVDGFELYHLQHVFGSTRSEPSSCQADGWPGRNGSLVLA